MKQLLQLKASCLFAAIGLLVASLTASAATVSSDSALFVLDTRILVSGPGVGSGDSASFVLDTRGNVGWNSYGDFGSFVLDTSASSLSVPG